MTQDQALLFGLLALIFVLLIWGRWRYDLVAFGGLILALLLGLVPTEAAFDGFGHPATVVIALVLIISRGLSNAGVVELVAGWLVDAKRSLGQHIAIMAGLSAGLSAVMNNVAALALLMPVDLQAAKSAKRAAGLTLMPLSFASILGGMITLIGTPPNIVIAGFREEEMGAPFAMFDFAPVGLACAVVGLAYLATIGWRLLPRPGDGAGGSESLFELKNYIAELSVPEGAAAIAKTLEELETAVQAPEEEEGETLRFLGLLRGGQRLPGGARRIPIEAGDVLVVKADPAGLERTAAALGLALSEARQGDEVLKAQDLELMEVVVPQGAAVEGRSLLFMPTLQQMGVRAIGVARQGQRLHQRLRRLPIRAGDILLLFGPAKALPEATQRLGALPLASRGLQVIQRDKAKLAVGIFAAAILLASCGLVYLTVALAAAALLFVLFRVVPLRELYQSVEWSVIVLLGSMIPIGEALETSGGSDLLAAGLLSLAEGAAPWVILTLLMVVTMTLSDVMNNTATAVIAAPIAYEIATRLEVSPDPFLMTVAVAASCAFLTPIGHKNNTLIMGPGGYRFGDYWRMGLPLEIIVIAVSVPMILLVWPL
ncbi:MAG: SLC13 family permease [Pseudomonadota bacterium]